MSGLAQTGFHLLHFPLPQHHSLPEDCSAPDFIFFSQTLNVILYKITCLM